MTFLTIQRNVTGLEKFLILSWHHYSNINYYLNFLTCVPAHGFQN